LWLFPGENLPKARERSALRTKPCFQASRVDLLLQTLQISFHSLISELEAHGVEGCGFRPGDNRADTR